MDHLGLVKNPSGGHCGNVHAVLPGDAIERGQQLLEIIPPAHLPNHTGILALAVCVGAHPGQSALLTQHCHGMGVGLHCLR